MAIEIMSIAHSRLAKVTKPSQKYFRLNGAPGCALMHSLLVESQPARKKEKQKMAHFVKLTQASPTGYTEEDSRVLFNLDTVISVEPVGDQTMIQTRWGRMTVEEDLDTILDLAKADRGGFEAPQLDSINRISEESLSL
ncbi:MAG: hypothetical protein H8E20_10195 [Verrucomicrobia bacterium]|nr:hypothetical protein [Verrucomicrobiota bacterium]